MSRVTKKSEMKNVTYFFIIMTLCACQRTSIEDLLNKSEYPGDLKYIISNDTSLKDIDISYVVNFTEMHISDLEGKRYETIISMAMDAKRKELTRETAQKLFEGLRFYEAMNTLPIYGELSFDDLTVYKCLENKGYFRIENINKSYPPFKLVALEDINKFIIFENDYGDIVLKLGDFQVNIENISEPANRGDGSIISYVTIKFTAQFNDLGECFAKKRGYGFNEKPIIATLKLYDNGWAIEEIKNKPWWYRMQPNTKSLNIKSFDKMATEYNTKEKSIPLAQRVKPEWFLGNWYDGGPTCLEIIKKGQNYVAAYYGGCYNSDNPPSVTLTLVDNNQLRNEDVGIAYKLIDYNTIEEVTSKRGIVIPGDNSYSPGNGLKYNRQ